MPSNPVKKQHLKFIPSVSDLLEDAQISENSGRMLPIYRTRIIREVLDDFRKNPGDKIPASKKAAQQILLPVIIDKLTRINSPFPKRVINGTGIHIHTNLGRAPLGKDILKSLPPNLSGYTNLEFDTTTSKRGSRDINIDNKLKLITGAEAALAVNNAASALFLILNTLSPGKPVLISRGELVEIGGSFRIPDIIEASGCILKELGTTNKTHLRDFQKHLNKETGVILKVHQSNFTQSGFVNHVSLRELGMLSKKTKTILIDDNGSGLLNHKLLQEAAPPGASPDLPSSEPDVSTSLKHGSHIVCFSGDKLMGGIQSGLIAGKKSLIQKMRRNPLYRILRLDKIRMSMLDYTLRDYLTGNYSNIPLWKSFQVPLAELKKKAAKINLKKAKFSFKELEWVPLKKQLGGGSDPEEYYDSWGLSMRHNKHSTAGLRDYFSNREIPIAGYSKKNRFIIDVSCLLAEDFPELQKGLEEI